MAPIPESPPNPAKYCSHKVAIANLARTINNPGLGNPVQHIHDPLIGKKGGKKKTAREVVTASNCWEPCKVSWTPTPTAREVGRRAEEAGAWQARTGARTREKVQVGGTDGSLPTTLRAKDEEAGGLREKGMRRRRMSMNA